MRRQPAGPSPDEVARWNESVAQLWDGATQIGHLGVRVELHWTTVGHLWLRRDIDPRPTFEYLIHYLGSDRWEEGWLEADKVDDECRDWEAGRFKLRGRTLSLRWLSGSERDVAWREFGWSHT